MDDLPDYEVGQIWKDRKRDPSCAFTITKVWTKTYENGHRTERVTGFVSGHGAHDRDLDARSVAKMFPYLLFAPPTINEDEEDK